MDDDSDGGGGGGRGNDNDVKRIFVGSILYFLVVISIFTLSIAWYITCVSLYIWKMNNSTVWFKHKKILGAGSNIYWIVCD